MSSDCLKSFQWSGTDGVHVAEQLYGFTEEDSGLLWHSPITHSSVLRDGLVVNANTFLIHYADMIVSRKFHGACSVWESIQLRRKSAYLSIDCSSHLHSEQSNKSLNASIARLIVVACLIVHNNVIYGSNLYKSEYSKE